MRTDELSSIRYKVGATHRTVSSHLNALVDSGLVVDRVSEPPADRDWANERPGTAGTHVHLVVRALRPPSPAV
jgi:DNA-binding transcriptional ArsR family regulator